MHYSRLFGTTAIAAALTLPAAASAATGPSAEGSVKVGSKGNKADGKADGGKKKKKAKKGKKGKKTKADKEGRKEARKAAIEDEKKKKWIKRHAPRRNSWELGVFGGVATPSRGLDLRADSVPFKRYNRLAGDVGLRFGYYFLSFLGLEGEFGILPGSAAGSGESALMYSGRLQPILQLPFWRIAPFGSLGIGFLGVSSDTTAFGNDTDFLFSYGGGVKFYLSRNVALRLDIRTNLTQKFQDPDAADTEEFLLGLTVRLGPRPKAKPPSDRDGDGFIDKEDACPDVAGVKPDGCPVKDSDGDGFLDPEDSCPQDKGVAPDGCPVKDSDGDGFLDDVDACPEEAGVEPDGCPIRDTDGDGIFDDVDACVNEPETVNGYEDSDGCPDEVPEAVKKFTGAIKGIYFETGKSDIRKKSETTLNASAKVLAEYTDIRVEISGHTDSRGKREMNMKLSAARASAVKDWLVAHGIDASRITTRGAGPDEPIADNKTRAGRSENRRIEFKIITE